MKFVVPDFNDSVRLFKGFVLFPEEIRSLPLNDLRGDNGAEIPLRKVHKSRICRYGICHVDCWFEEERSEEFRPTKGCQLHPDYRLDRFNELKGIVDPPR